MYEPKEHEVLFGITPVGVKYICEFCNEGEMKADASQVMHPAGQIPMFPHTCTKCGKSMQLPKVYPYVDWTEINSEESANNITNMVKFMIDEMHKRELGVKNEDTK